MKLVIALPFLAGALAGPFKGNNVCLQAGIFQVSEFNWNPENYGDVHRNMSLCRNCHIQCLKKVRNFSDYRRGLDRVSFSHVYC